MYRIKEQQLKRFNTENNQIPHLTEVPRYLLSISRGICWLSVVYLLVICWIFVGYLLGISHVLVGIFVGYLLVISRVFVGY